MMKLSFGAGLSFAIAAMAAGCSDVPATSPDPTPVISAEAGGFSFDTPSSAQLELVGVDELVQAADGSDGATTRGFLDVFPFGPEAPNRAEVFYGRDRNRIEVVLASPVYDSAARTLLFDVVDPPAELPSSMNRVEIRLGDCPDENYLCAWSDITTCGGGIGPVGTCWSWIGLSCSPCDCKKDIRRCTEANPKCCPDHGGCVPARLAPAPQGLERFCL